MSCSSSLASRHRCLVLDVDVVVLVLDVVNVSAKPPKAGLMLGKKPSGVVPIKGEVGSSFFKQTEPRPVQE